MFLMFVAISALIIIAILPALVDPEERRAWCKRLFYCRGWDLNVDVDDILQRYARTVLSLFSHSLITINGPVVAYQPVDLFSQISPARTLISRRNTRSGRVRENDTNGEIAHFVLSPTQEEEIRDSFIKDRLKTFSMVRSQICTHVQRIVQLGPYYSCWFTLPLTMLGSHDCIMFRTT